MYTRSYEGITWFILLNRSDVEATSMSVDFDTRTQLIIANYEDIASYVSVQNISLRPHEVRILSQVKK